MIKNLITKEKFAEEFDLLQENDVDALDAIMTITTRYELTEDQVPRLLNDKIMQLLSDYAIKNNFIKDERGPTLDDFF